MELCPACAYRVSGMKLAVNGQKLLGIGVLLLLLYMPEAELTMQLAEVVDSRRLRN